MKVRINKAQLKDALGIKRGFFSTDEFEYIELDASTCQQTCCCDGPVHLCGYSCSRQLMERSAYERGYYDGKRDEHYRSFREVATADLVKKLQESLKSLDELRKELGIDNLV